VPRFTYVALTAEGEEARGTRDALTEAAVRSELLRQNLDVIEVKQRRKFNEIELSPKRVAFSDIMHFSRQLAAFVRGGVPITDGLNVIAQGSANKRLREILLTMREAISQGTTFADALAEHARILPPYYIGVIRSAELTGRLDTALEQLSTYMERDLDAKSKVKSAMIYPAVVLVMSIGAVMILAVYVLPKFADLFSSLSADLPLSTRMIIAAADISKKFWWVLPILVVGFVALIIAVRRTQRGRRIKDRFLLRIPLIKSIVLYSVIERIFRILASMSRAGVPLTEALTAAISGSNNSVFEERLSEAQERMLEGEGLAGPISMTQLFPPAALQMLRVGEDTGTLEMQLENAADYYGRELDFKLKRLTTLFEPAVIVVMGIIVGFVAIALVQAMYGVYGSSGLKSVPQ
jgi:type IV pilus assembly protein PilC